MDDYRAWTVDLPKSAVAWEEGRTEDLEDTLEDDLAGKVLDFLYASCESGGGPEDDEVMVDGVEIDGNTLTANVTVDFTEVIPSSCKDMPYHERRIARYVIALRRGETTATVAYSSADPNTWDQADRNSAADGF